MISKNKHTSAPTNRVELPAPQGYVKLPARVFACLCVEFERCGGNPDELLAIAPEHPAFQSAARVLRGAR